MKKITLAFLALFASQMAYAVSQDDLIVKRNDEEEWVEMVRGSNTVMMTLYYVGSASESVVDITPTYIRAYAPAGTADSSNFGSIQSSYSFVTTTAATLGDLCKVIDNLSNYVCELKAGRYSDLPGRLRDQLAASGTNDLKADGGFDVLADTDSVSGAVGLPGSVAGTKRTEWIRVFHKPPQGKRAIFKKCVMQGNSGAFDLTFSLYGKPRKYESNFVLLNNKTAMPIASSNTNTSNRSFGPVVVSTTLAQLSQPWGAVGFTFAGTTAAYTTAPAIVEFGAQGAPGGFEFAQDVIGIAEITPADNGGTAITIQQEGTSYLWCSGIDR